VGCVGYELGLKPGFFNVRCRGFGWHVHFCGDRSRYVFPAYSESCSRFSEIHSCSISQHCYSRPLEFSLGRHNTASTFTIPLNPDLCLSGEPALAERYRYAPFLLHTNHDKSGPWLRQLHLRRSHLSVSYAQATQSIQHWSIITLQFSDVVRV